MVEIFEALDNLEAIHLTSTDFGPRRKVQDGLILHC